MQKTATGVDAKGLEHVWKVLSVLLMQGRVGFATFGWTRTISLT